MATGSSITSPTTAPPACLLDDIGSSLTSASVVRMMALLWTIPASLVLVAGVRIIFDRPLSPLATGYVDLSRAASVVLAAFSLVIGGIWLVRSGRSLPSLGDLTGTRMSAAGHLRFGAVAVVGLVGGLVVASPVVATAAAVAGFLAGLVLPRWIIRISVPPSGTATIRLAWERDRAVACASGLATLIVFEVTVGWWHSMLMTKEASMLFGVVAVVRGVSLTVAVAAMVIGSRRQRLP